jgi:hypothetical protein
MSERPVEDHRLPVQARNPNLLRMLLVFLCRTSFGSSVCKASSNPTVCVRVWTSVFIEMSFIIFESLLSTESVPSNAPQHSPSSTRPSAGFSLARLAHFAPPSPPFLLPPRSTVRCCRSTTSCSRCTSRSTSFCPGSCLTSSWRLAPSRPRRRV